MDKYAKECIDRTKALRLPYAFMTPDYVATIAYNAHSAGEHGQKNPLTKAVAEREVKLFNELVSSLDNLQNRYVHKVHGEFVSLANAISRGKEEYLREVSRITAQYADQEAAFNTTWMARATWRTIWRLVSISGFATMGATVARAIIPVFSETTAHNTGYALPTIAAGCLAAWAGNAFSGWWQENKRARTAKAKHLELQNARTEHDSERLHQIVKHLERLHAIWYEYTGVEYWVPVKASYAHVIEEDIEIATRLEREFARQTMSPLRLFLQICLQRARSFRKHGDDGTVIQWPVKQEKDAA